MSLEGKGGGVKSLKSSKAYQFCFLLALIGCAGVETPQSRDEIQIIQRGSISVIQGSFSQVQEICGAASNLQDVKGHILGCWIPSLRSIVIQTGDSCIGLHEAFHALGWDHGPPPHSGCGLK